MAVHPTLLDLQKDTSPLAVSQNSPFLLSLRDPEEFSEIHSFGVFKVPHIGVYGSEYTLCSAVVLLSLPAIPRCLQQLPTDLICALDLERELPTPREAERTAARKLVQLVLEAACRRAALTEGEGGLRNRMDSSPAPGETAFSREAVGTAVEGGVRKYRTSLEMEVGGGGGDTVSNAMETNSSQSRFANPTMPSMETENASSQSRPARSRRQGQFINPSPSTMETENTSSQSRPARSRNRVQFADPTAPSLATTQLQEDESLTAERRGVARRLVLKCISAACHKLTIEDRRDSMEYLLSSIKRMRISSPSPSSEESRSPVPEKSQSLLPDKLVVVERCVTPESMKMQKLRKKRGRSDSHEVNSLTDYNMIRRHLQEVVAGSGERGAGQHFGNIKEEDEVTQHMLSALAENLGMMAIDEDYSGSEEESPPASPPNTTPSFFKTPPSTTLPEHLFNTPSLLAPLNFQPSQFRAQANGIPPDTTAPPNTQSLFPANTTPFPLTAPPSFFSAPSKTTLPVPSPFPASAETTPPQSYPRRTANIGSVPGMDLYIIIHSCPPRGMCQKFLCNNSDEINLVYHCWLFGSAPCDPSVVLSDELALGVFEPCGVQPVHLELQDAGAPFHYIENRTICIHSCCFSPDNAQLQLVQGLDIGSSAAFHSFFSAARHGERRVAALHILPSSIFVENTLRESLAGCTTLKQLLLRLRSQSPEIGSKIWNLVSLL